MVGRCELKGTTCICYTCRWWRPVGRGRCAGCGLCVAEVHDGREVDERQGVIDWDEDEEGPAMHGGRGDEEGDEEGPAKYGGRGDMEGDGGADACGEGAAKDGRDGDTGKEERKEEKE